MALGLGRAPRFGVDQGGMDDVSIENGRPRVDNGCGEVFLACAPGLEPAVLAEARRAGLTAGRALNGGVAIHAGWDDVWRANLTLRCVNRVLWRVDSFRVMHLAQLDKRARRIDWAAVVAPGTPVRVEATCKESKIYHSGAAAERVANAVVARAGAQLGSSAQGDGDAHGAALTVLVRIEDNTCTISVDTSGDLLHKRGAKRGVGKAPLRETLAAWALDACGFDGREAVIDPMCGSGTVVLEAADMATGLPAGRDRAFAFERLSSFDADRYGALRQSISGPAGEGVDPHPEDGSPGATSMFFGFDRDPSAVRQSQANAQAADLAGVTRFAGQSVSQLEPPAALNGQTGLILTNPPYGARLGDKGALRALYNRFGRVVRERFAGWRVGVITSEPSLARATGLELAGPPSPPIPHGPLRIKLYQFEV